MKKDPKEDVPIIIIALLIVFFIVFPISIDAFVVSQDIMSFWGSYLGGISGALGVIFTTYWLIKTQSEKEAREFANQTRITKNTILIEVKLKQMQDIIQSLLNVKVNIETYFINITKCIEYHTTITKCEKDYSFYKSIDDYRSADLLEKQFYEFQNKYNLKLEENLKSLQVLDKEINHIKAINKFTKIDDLQLDEYYTDLRATFNSYVEMMDSKKFGEINLEEIHKKEIECTGKIKKMLEKLYTNLDNEISNFEENTIN